MDAFVMVHFMYVLKVSAKGEENRDRGYETVLAFLYA